MTWKFFTSSQWSSFSEGDSIETTTLAYTGTGGIFFAGSTFDFNADEVILLLSGGSSNSNSSKSVGGPASFSQIPTFLFDNIKLAELSKGRTDYRCVYLYNGDPIYTLTGTQVYVKDKPYGGSSIRIGTFSQSEVQNVMVKGAVSGGGFVLSYDATNFTVNYNSNPAVWASNFQTAIRAVPGLESTTIGYGAGTDVIVFTVNFFGIQIDRFQSILELVSNSLTGSTGIVISKISDGSPINSIAEQVPSDLSAPSNVAFQKAYSSPITIGDLEPGDLVSIWIERVTPTGTTPVQDDGFLFAIVADPMD